MPRKRVQRMIDKQPPRDVAQCNTSVPSVAFT